MAEAPPLLIDIETSTGRSELNINQLDEADTAALHACKAIEPKLRLPTETGGPDAKRPR